MISKTLSANTALSAQLPYLARHSLLLLGSALLCSTLGIYVIEGEEEKTSTVQQNKHVKKQR